MTTNSDYLASFWGYHSDGTELEISLFPEILKVKLTRHSCMRLKVLREPKISDLVSETLFWQREGFVLEEISL